MITITDNIENHLDTVKSLFTDYAEWMDYELCFDGFSEEMTNLRPFSRIRWLGGSPCSGKSSVSTMLSRRSRLDLYQVDDALRGQMARIIPDQHPALSSWLAASCDGRN